MEGGLLLDVIVSECAAILKLLSGKNQSLLVWGDTLLVLDLGLNVINGVGAFNLKGDGLPRKGLDKNLHSTSEPEHQVEGGLLLDVVVGEGAAILKLLSGENQPLLVWGNALLVLNLGLDIVDGVGAFDLKGDGLPSEGLDEDLHSTTEPEHQVEGGLLLDVVVGEGAAVLELFPGKDQPLLVWGDALLVLNLSFDIINGVRAFHLEGDGLTGEGFHEDLHLFDQSTE